MEPDHSPTQSICCPTLYVDTRDMTNIAMILTLEATSMNTTLSDANWK